MEHRVPMLGRKFFMLEVIDFLEQTKSSDSYWVCVCDCGALTAVAGSLLRRQSTLSCGCWRKQWCKTHGHTNTRTYRIWQNMKARGSPENAHKYPDYAGRGIFVCARWRKFENFLADMGEAPPNLTLERVDNDKGYSPKNCVWDTYSAQVRNRRVGRFVYCFGVYMHLQEACDKTGIPYYRAIKRLQRGQSIDDLFGEQHAATT